MRIIIDKNDMYSYTDNIGNDKIIYGSLNGKFEIGDKVEVISIGQSYSSYEDMAYAMEIPKNRWNKYHLKNRYIGEVIARKVHSDESDILYGVKFNGVKFNSIHIIGEDGLKLIEKRSYINKFNDKDFEI